MSASTDRSAVDKALDLVEAVAQADHPLRLTDVAAQVGLHRATAYRVLAKLVGRGWIIQVAEGYMCGPALPQLSPTAARSTLSALAHAALAQLTARSDLMTNLQVLEPSGARVIDVVRPRRLDMIEDLRGRLLPMGRFAGPTSLVALLDEAQRTIYFDAVFPDGAQTSPAADGTGLDRASLAADIARTVACGYAIERERNEKVIASMSKAFRPGGKFPDFALTVVGLTSDFSDDRLDQFSQWLEDAGDDVCRRLGATSATTAPAPSVAE